MMAFRILSVIAIVLLICLDCVSSKLLFQFNRYHYKKKPRTENIFRRETTRCEKSPECSLRSGLGLTKCVRTCISPECYDELYAFDELEEGEIDVRSNSFKGCWVKKNLKNINKIDR